MRICKTICLILSVLLLVSPVLGVSAAETDASVTAGCHSVDAAKAVGGSEKIVDTAKAVILYERTTGTMVYAYNADQQIYPSSMVKLMTAVVALEHGELTDMVTVTRSALQSEDLWYVSMDLKRDEQITLKDLLYGMMVASANDACAVIAEHIAGSQEAFVALMNEKARNLGCTGTNFTNTHGLHEEDNYTTARDILKILEYGLQDPDFKAMYETMTYTVPSTNMMSEERTLTTKNFMMDEGHSRYYDSRVTGGKTGSTDAAGRCLTVTAKAGDMELIGIVMGAEATYSETGDYLTRFGSFEEMRELLDYAEDRFECRQLFYEDQVIAQYPVAEGRNFVVTTPVSECRCVLPKDIQADQLTWSYAETAEGLTAPVSAGQTISTMEVWYGSICLAQTELVAMNDVAVYVPYAEPQSEIDEKNEEAHGEILALILGVILGIVVVVILGMFLMRIVQTALIKARIRRRRKNRRRNRNNARME